MDEKTTNELNHILKSCTTLSHLDIMAQLSRQKFDVFIMN